MQHYELTYIVPMSYTIDEVPEINKMVTGLLKENGAEILKEESMGKQKFAYPIDHLSHGYYQVVEFDMNPEGALGINKQLQITNEVLRYMLVKKKIKSEKELAAEQRLREKIAQQEQERKTREDEEEEGTKRRRKPAPRKTKEDPKAEEKVSIDDLDKKLDSILEGEDMIQ